MSTPLSGELVHLDIKQLGRFWHVGKRALDDGVQHSRYAGWSYAHVAVDDHSRHAHRAAAQHPRPAIDCVAFTQP